MAVAKVPYDEFGLFHENAAENGLPFDGPPAVRRQAVNLGDGPYHATLHYADFGGVPQAEFDMYGNAVFGGKVVVRVGDHERVIDVPAGGGEVTFK